MPVNLTRMLRTVLGQLESRRAQIAEQIGALRAALDGRSRSSSSPAAAHGRARARRMTAAQRAEVSRRMKAYWTQWRAQRKRTAA